MSARYHTRRKDTLRKRTELAFYFIAAWFVLLSYRLFDIQVRRHAFFNQRAAKYHNRSIVVEAARGIFRDRQGNSLTQNLPVKSVYADPSLVEDPSAVARQLAPILDRSPDYLERQLSRKGSFSWLRRKVDRKTERAVRALNLKGIDFVPETRRIYPLKTTASNLVGFANIDGKGIDGLERQLEASVAGQPGWIKAEVDALGRIIPGTTSGTKPTTDGHNVRLTIDLRIQHVAEAAIEKAYTTYQATGVSAVVLDPQTGEILAMASRPTYDPNEPGKSDAEQRRNRGAMDDYEPGSTLKSITACAALQEHAITTSSTFGCAGSYQIGKKRIRCVLHGPYKNGHGTQTIRGILRESCNIGTAQIAMRLGSKKLYRYIADFGFVGDTRCGLLGEQRGWLDPPSGWPQIKLANVGFGQGVTVTPLQVATAYAAIANGGKLMQPYYISRVEDTTGKLIQEYHPKVIRQVISPETAATVADCLLGVCEEGTGKPARVEGYSVAGKTGSAQKAAPGGRGYIPGRFVASFVGFAPVKNPRVVAIVVVDEPKGSHWGATCAAPAFQETVQGALWCMKVPPDRPVDLQRPVVGMGRR